MLSRWTWTGWYDVRRGKNNKAVWLCFIMSQCVCCIKWYIRDSDDDDGAWCVMFWGSSGLLLCCGRYAYAQVRADLPRAITQNIEIPSLFQ